MPGGRLHYGQPINREYPLNRGLLAEWAVVPWYASGPRWIDLGRDRNHGTLTNGPTWTSALGRPGGYGAVSFDGSNDYAALANDLDLSAGLTVACWFRAASLAAAFNTIFGNGNAAGSQYHVELDIVSSGNINIFQKLGGSNNLWASSGLGITTGVWYYLVAAVDSAGTTAAYLNGQSVTLTGSGTASTQGAGTLPASIGRLGAFNSQYWSGYLDDVTLWSGRALSSSEAWLVYDQSRRGNPDRWSWVADRAYLFAPPAAAVTPAAPSLVFPGSGGSLPGISFPGV